MAFFVLPFMVLNSVGAVVALVWLAILREWLTIGLGVAIGIFGTVAINPAIMLGMILFGGPGMALMEKGKKKWAIVVVILQSIYFSLLITAWCLAVLWLFLRITKEGSRIPAVIWAYGVSTGPWAYLAQKDSQAGNDKSATYVFFAEVDFVVIGLVVLLGNPRVLSMAYLFAAIMVVPVLFNLAEIIAESRRIPE